ncbi:hypothetical protein KCP73_14600 [Salmonella enterica subsp. enterica]|nr:hypothetical protein KCP73_14600 [Salmonella enterica subsp. enterica]
MTMWAPPDDSGDDDDTLNDSVITFSNGVTIDKGKERLAASMAQSWITAAFSRLPCRLFRTGQPVAARATADGKTLNVTGWDVTVYMPP